MLRAVAHVRFRAGLACKHGRGGGLSAGFTNSRISRHKTHLFAPGSSALGALASTGPRTQLIFRCQIIFQTESSFKVEEIPLWKTNSGQA